MTDFAHSIALIIGIDAYGNGIRPLTTAVNDATRLADLLRTVHGYETILLTQEYTGKLVTQEQVRLLFEELKSRLGEDDRLLFYFAGHGVALDGDDGPRGYLVPQDANPQDPASLLAMTDLHGWLTALPCRHMLAILDCCFAGAFRWSATRHIGTLPDVIYRERYDRYLVSPAWQVLTSAAYDQKALDVLNGNTIGVRESNGKPQSQSHSPFALALFDALEKGDADLIPKNGGDGVITATELYLYLREQVEVQADTQTNHEQTPGLWPLNRHRKGEFIFLVPGHALNLPPAPDLTAEANPYRGLKSYDQKHTKLFFGRDAEIQELADRVDQQPFVAVLGASGTGKSSLVKAGVLPRLLTTEDKAQAAGPVFKVLAPFRPTDHPIQALTALLRAELGESLPGLADDNALARIVARWSESHPGQRLVLTIDQFEELVTLCQDHERERFLGLLAAAVQGQPDAFRLIITLRTDFEPQFTRNEETEQGPLAELWPAARYIVPPMDIEDLRQVIEGPASVQVLYFNPPELVDDLIKEVIQTPGALPLLSFTLSELYVKYVQSGRDDRALSGVDYKALGGVVGSLRNRATEEYDRLPDDAHRLTMQRVMLRMVAVEGSELARRRVAQSELDYPTQEENIRVQTILDRLVEARLLVRGTADRSDGTQGEAYIEPAHDALVLAWDMLLRWKKEADEYLPLQRRLALAATEWDKAESKEKSGLLWDDDPRLPQVEETLWPTGTKQKGGLRGRIRRAWQVMAPKIDAPADTKWVNGVELKFIQTSVSRHASTLRRVIGITAAVIVALASLAIFASYQADRATQQRDIAVTAEAKAVFESNARATEVVVRTTAQRRTDANLRALQAQTALESGEDNSGSLPLLLAREAVSASLQAGEHPPLSATTILRKAVENASPWQWTVPNNRPIFSGENSFARFSPDGHYLIAGMIHPAPEGFSASVLDAETGQEIHYLGGHTNYVTDVAFSHDGRSVATFSSTMQEPPDTVIQIWNIVTGASIGAFIGHSDFLWSVDFSPDDQMILSASQDGTARLWQIADGVAIRLFPHPKPVNSAFFCGDGSLFVTATNDNTVYAWAIQSDKPLHTWQKVTSPVCVPDQPIVVVGGEDGAVHYLDIHSGQELRSFGTHSEAIKKIIVGFSGDYLVTISENHTILWKADTEVAIRDFGRTDRIVFSADGSLLFTSGSADFSNTAFVWDVEALETAQSNDSMDIDTFAQVAQISGHTFPIESAEFSPDGQHLITSAGNFGPCQTCTVDNTIRLWNLRSAVRDFRARSWGYVDQDSLSQDGQLVAASGRLWDFDTGIEVKTMNRDDSSTFRINIVSPDSKLVASLQELGTSLVVWSAKSGEVVKSFDPSPTPDGLNSYRAVTFSPDSVWLAAVDDNGVYLWDTRTFALYRKIPIQDFAKSLSFSPLGSLLAVALNDSTVHVWNVIENREVFVVVPVGIHRPAFYDEALSAVFSPDGKELAVTYYHDNMARLWSTENGEFIRAFGPHLDIVNAVGFSPDGTILATASGNDNIYGSDKKDHDWRVRLWDAKTGELIDMLEKPGRHQSLFSVSFSPDGRTIMASDYTQPVIWRSTTEILAASARLIQRQPPEFTVEERERFNFDNAPDSDAMQIQALTYVDQAYVLAEQGDIPSAAIKYREAMALDSSLDVDPEAEAGRIYASVLIEEGNSLAELGDLSGAVTKYREALALNPSLSWTAYDLVSRGNALAEQGDVLGAVTKYQLAMTLDPSLDIDPEAEAGRIYVSFLIEGGSVLAKQGDISGAVTKYQLAMTLDPSLDIDPAAEAGRIYVSFLIEGGSVMAEQGDISGAVAKYQEALVLNPDLKGNPDSAQASNSLCWYGTVYDHADQVLEACEIAVRLAPEDGGIRDSRGLAYALTGNVAGAIEDFTFVLEWAKQAGWDEATTATREAWLVDLRTGVDPAIIFDAATLESLR